MKRSSRRPSATRARSPLLAAPGWQESVRRRLETLIRRGAGRGLPVVFDFDHTLVCGDIGEAALAVLVRNGRLKPDGLSPTLSPAVIRPGHRKPVTPSSEVDLTAYYDAYLAPTGHGVADRAPHANGYAWAVEIMEGLSTTDVLRATEEAFRFGAPGERRLIEVTPGKTALPAPHFYPEMVELIAVLIRHGFDVWIVSASNVWSVRWMVLRQLNPLLSQHGVRRGVRAEQVVGVSTLLRDPRGRLWKDPLLVRENPRYARLEARVMGRLRLTSRLHFPVPAYSGKVAALWDALGLRPYLAAGDSPGDHPMLDFSENRLWIARLEKPDYQEETVRLMARTGRDTWMIQPTLTMERPGFLTDSAAIPPFPLPRSSPIRKSLRWLRPGLES